MSCGHFLTPFVVLQGHAIAGGCVLSLACDLSIMATGYRIGLPELALVIKISNTSVDTSLYLAGSWGGVGGGDLRMRRGV